MDPNSMICPHLGQAEFKSLSFPPFGVHALCNPLLTAGGTCEYAVSSLVMFLNLWHRVY